MKPSKIYLLIQKPKYCYDEGDTVVGFVYSEQEAKDWEKEDKTGTRDYDEIEEIKEILK